MFAGLPGGSTGGRPIGTVAFWVVILCTLAVIGAFAWFVSWAVSTIQ